MVKLLFGLVWVGAVIAQPGTIEAGFILDVRSERGDGNLQVCELGLKETTGVGRPSVGSGVDRAKFFKDGISKCGACCYTSVSLAINPSQVSRKKSDDNGRHKFVEFLIDVTHDFWWWLNCTIAMTPLWLLVFKAVKQRLLLNMKPNVPANRHFAEGRFWARLSGPKLDRHKVSG